MSAQKPVYSRPSDDEPTPTPKKRQRRHGRRRKGLHTTEHHTATIQDDGVAFLDPITEAKSIAKRDHLQNDGVTKRDPTTTAKSIVERAHLQDDGVAEHHPATTGAHHKRNRRTHHREKRRARELRAENELLHRRLAAIYDALTLD